MPHFDQSLVAILSIANSNLREIHAAYIDPGTGGMLFQLLAVLFAVFSGLILFFSRQIKTAFARFKRFLIEKFQS
ncbi:MAG: hypothetical protein P8X95_16550 [Anaerolineales bacterium]|jgi:hypothetical protein